jgi:hypothetical protein
VRQFRRLVSPLDAVILALENGEDRPEATLGLLAALGVEDGTPDLAVFMIRGGLKLIEVKLERTLHHPRTGLSDAQRRLHDVLGFLGHEVSTVRSSSEFWAVVDALGVPHRPLDRTEQLMLPIGKRAPPRPEPSLALKKGG